MVRWIRSDSAEISVIWFEWSVRVDRVAMLDKAEISLIWFLSR